MKKKLNDGNWWRCTKFILTVYLNRTCTNDWMSYDMIKIDCERYIHERNIYNWCAIAYISAAKHKMNNNNKIMYRTTRRYEILRSIKMLMLFGVHKFKIIHWGRYYTYICIYFLGAFFLVFPSWFSCSTWQSACRSIAIIVQTMNAWQYMFLFFLHHAMSSLTSSFIFIDSIYQGDRWFKIEMQKTRKKK